jgi:16S rRNA (guanine527-N7)-methyltransferase
MNHKSATGDRRGEPGLADQLVRYQRLLASWPGLSSRPDMDLIEDCLVLLDHLGDARSAIDVGSGGGMPGLPLKLARPDLAVTLLEADQRKAAFLVHASAALGLDGVPVLAERAETVAHGPHRESFDLAVCRALAPMPVLAELCLPFVRVGGRLLAMKVSVESAGRALEALGGGQPRVVPAPTRARPRGVVVDVPKVRPTPPGYPRRPGLPARRPLA